MSSYLWKYYLEDDIDQFRQLLETASYNLRPNAQKGNTGSQGSYVGTAISNPSTFSTSPRLSYKGRKASGKGPAPNASSAPLALTRADLNSRDPIGLTILHHASSSTSENAIAFALALVEHPLTDLYIQDLENGWTPLHRAFYFGNVTIARAIIDRDLDDALGRGSGGIVQHAGNLIKVKDKEGNAPFDVLATTIKDRTLHHDVGRTGEAEFSEDDDEEAAHGVSGDIDEDEGRKAIVKPLVNLQGDDLFTFGSNKNLTLGFGDEDDRQYPERVLLRRPDHLLRRFYREYLASRATKWGSLDESYRDKLLEVGPSKPISSLPWLIRSKPVIFQDVYMSKFHTAILTTDPESNLYMCGHGPGGRLGTGSERTQFNFVCIEGGALESKKVITVALGLNHSLAVSEEGEIFSWGNNAFGQLGYALPISNMKDEDPLQLLPRQIFGSLKREVIVGVAASRIHSVAYTGSGLYTFGKNEGQLGIVDSDARSLETQAIPRRVAASLFSSPIKIACAIDRATICLLEDHEVWVFANYGYSRLAFPLDGFTNYFLKNSFMTTKYDTTPNKISKIASGGDTICAMSTTGEVFTVSIAHHVEQGSGTSTSTTNPTKIRNALSAPLRIWSLKKGHMAARDVGVDQDGSIILTTKAGSVWRRTKRPKVKDASAAGTGEYKPKDYKFSRVSGLTRVIAVRASAYGAYAAVRKECDVTRTQIIVDEQSIWKHVYPLLSFRTLASMEYDADSQNPSLRFWQRPTEIDRLQKMILESKDLERDLTQVVRLEQLSNDVTYDTFVTTTTSDVTIPVHSFMLAARSPVLRQALGELCTTRSFLLPEILSIKTSNDSTTLIVFQGFDILTLVNLVLYVYTDILVSFWHHTKQAPTLAFRYRQVRTELMKVASRLELQRLEPAVRQMVEPKRSLDMEFKVAIKDPSFFQHGDIEVRLEDSNVLVHRALICQRCPFFEGLFKGRAGGRWLAERRELLDNSQLVSVDLKHVPLNIFQLVLRHIYADAGEELFDDVVTSNQDEFLDLIMDVLSVANELMLDRLSQVCQKVLGHFVNARSACQLLNAVAPSSVTELKDAGLEYLCLNLEAMLENHLLDELDEDLLLELDQVVRANQLACLPFSKSGRAEALLHDKYPELAEMIHRSRQSKIDAIALHAKHILERPFVLCPFGGSSLEDLSTSPTEQKGRRSSVKGSKLLPPSPKFKVKPSATGMIFDFEEDAEPRDPRKEQNMLASEDAAMANEKLIGDPTELDAVLGSPRLSLPPTEMIEPSENTIRPWGVLPLQARKLDMREIMAQASSMRTSSLSLGLTAQHAREDRASGSFSAKLSQRERKQQQQGQPLVTPTIPSTPDRTAPSPAASSSTSSPWQISPHGPRIAPKELIGKAATAAAAAQPAPGTTLTLDSKPSRSSTTPHLTVRQTIANPSSGGKQKPTIATSPQISAQQRTLSGTVDSKKPSELTSSRGPTTYRPSLSPHQSRRHSSSKTPMVPTTSPSTSASGKGFAISDPTSPPPIPQSIRHVPSPAQIGASEPNVQLSMADILSQEQAKKDAVKEAAVKRSLMDIQVEQEFQAWWDMESARLQEEQREGREERENREAREVIREAGGSRTRGRGRPKGAGRSRGGRGRGGPGENTGSRRVGSGEVVDAEAAQTRSNDRLASRGGGTRGRGRGGATGAEAPVSKELQTIQ